MSTTLDYLTRLESLTRKERKELRKDLLTNFPQMVEHLNELGYKVWVEHSRYLYDSLFPAKAIHAMGAGMKSVDPNGGRTIVEICKDEKVLAFGVSLCSERDPYNKAIGRAIALGRALKSL